MKSLCKMSGESILTVICPSKFSSHAILFVVSACASSIYLSHVWGWVGAPARCSASSTPLHLGATSHTHGQHLCMAQHVVMRQAGFVVGLIRSQKRDTKCSPLVLSSTKGYFYNTYQNRIMAFSSNWKYSKAFIKLLARNSASVRQCCHTTTNMSGHQ